MGHILSNGLYVRRAFCSQTLTEAASYADLQEVRQPADKWLQNTLTATLQHWSIPKAPRWNLKPFAKQHFDKLSLISILKITLKSGDNIKMGIQCMARHVPSMFGNCTCSPAILKSLHPFLEIPYPEPAYFPPILQECPDFFKPGRWCLLSMDSPSLFLDQRIEFLLCFTEFSSNLLEFTEFPPVEVSDAGQKNLGLDHWPVMVGKWY